MPTFATPQSITADVQMQFVVATIHVLATGRADTVVRVLPTNPARRADVLAAERTTVACIDDRLTVHAQKSWRRYSWSSDGGSVEVHIECPIESDLRIAASMGAARMTGRLGRVHVTMAVGELCLEEATAAVLRVAGLGDVTAGHVEQDAEISTGSGAIRIEAVGGDLQAKNSNGDTWVGFVGGATVIKVANGDIAVGAAADSVTAKTSNGHIRLAGVRRGDVVAESGCGGVEVTVTAGVPAWLDLYAGLGRVRNELDDATAPASGENTVRVRARSGAGDVTVRRADSVAVAPR